jgi:nucleoside-diphosphate-sugar epimerase
LVLPSSPDKLSSTTKFIWDILSGKDIPENATGFGGYVDVRDVARLTVFGVQNAQKADSQRFIVANSWASPQAAADILRRERPDRLAIIKEGVPHGNYRSDFKAPEQAPQIDSSKAPKTTGQDWISFESTVLDAAKLFEVYL